MVQRKVPNKLGNGIQFRADYIKREKWLGSLKLSTCQHQDGKNKGTDLKKKMKKSRSIKLSDTEGLRSSSSSFSSSSSSRETIARPGKPPSLNVPAASSTTPQKKCMIKAIDGSPNFMKSTSSSEAKKESSSQVSSRNTQTGSHSKNLLRNSTGSCNNKAGRILTRTSSLKLVRTLTKSPTFKPFRISAKKCSGVALCTDMNVQRATCSSTLKDSKFPTYLMLNPGGTESEGTSIMKVCPYAYCSLNGHHHAPLPSLKYFLKSRRRSMKTQRSMKMEALRPPREKPSGDEDQGAFGNKPPTDGVDLANSPMSPLMQGGPMEFFIEIYAKGKGNDAEASRGSTRTGAEKMNDSRCGNETAPELGTDKPVSESLSEGSLHSEIDFDENLEHCGGISSKVDIPELKNDVDEGSRRIFVEEKSSAWNFTDVDKQEGISSVDLDHTVFKVIDMEWKEWPTSDPGDEAHSSRESDDESHLNIGDSSETDRTNLPDKFVTSSEESNSKTGLIGIAITPSSGEELTSGKDKMLANGVPGTVNEVSEADSLLEVPESSCSIDLKVEAFESTEQFQLQSFDELEHDETNDLCPEKELPSGEAGDQMEAGKVTDAELLIGIYDSSHVLAGADKDDNEVEDDQNNQLCEVNNAIDEGFSTEDTADENLFFESRLDGQHESTHVADNQIVPEKDRDEAKFKVPTSMDSEEQNRSRMHKTSLAVGMEEKFPTASDKISRKPKSKFSFTKSNAKKELPNNSAERKWTIRCKRLEENYEESRKFNPREPNFLPVVPDLDAEKVDLRHQMMDERKNAEEWMLDHALQQAVTKLAPARKRKVALLVEAFETVLPLSKCETHLRHASTGFAHERPIQACN